MFDDEVSPDGRWRITWILKKDFHAFFEMETQWEILVVHEATRRRFERFFRDAFENSAGTQVTGVSSVHFTDDGAAVIAHYEDGKMETIALPKDDIWS
jgi:hypothetical protein